MTYVQTETPTLIPSNCGLLKWIFPRRVRINQLLLIIHGLTKKSQQTPNGPQPGEGLTLFLLPLRIIQMTIQSKRLSFSPSTHQQKLRRRRRIKGGDNLSYFHISIFIRTSSAAPQGSTLSTTRTRIRSQGKVIIGRGAAPVMMEYLLNDFPLSIFPPRTLLPLLPLEGDPEGDSETLVLIPRKSKWSEGRTLTPSPSSECPQNGGHTTRDYLWRRIRNYKSTELTRGRDEDWAGRGAAEGERKRATGQAATTEWE